MPLEVNVVGTVEAFSTVAVRAQVTGELKAVNFQTGRRRGGRPGPVRACRSAGRWKRR